MTIEINLMQWLLPDGQMLVLMMILFWIVFDRRPQERGLSRDERREETTD